MQCLAEMNAHTKSIETNGNGTKKANTHKNIKRLESRTKRKKHNDDEKEMYSKRNNTVLHTIRPMRKRCIFGHITFSFNRKLHILPFVLFFFSQMPPEMNSFNMLIIIKTVEKRIEKRTKKNS